MTFRRIWRCVMFAIVKTSEGWTVTENGVIVAVECSLLSAAAIKAHLESGAGPDPEEHTLADDFDAWCDCGVTGPNGGYGVIGQFPGCTCAA